MCVTHSGVGGPAGHNSFWLFNDWRQEVDIFEQTGGNNATQVSSVASNLHAFKCSAECPDSGCTKVCDGDKCGSGVQHSSVVDFTDDFHVWSFELRPDHMTWMLDGAVTAETTNKTAIALKVQPQFCDTIT